MVTISALKLAIDATGMSAGARQGVTAVDSLTSSLKVGTNALDIYGTKATQIFTAQESAARRAADAADRVREFNKAAGASNEIVSTTNRVRLLGEEVRNLGSGFSSASSIGTLFGASLIDVAQAGIRAEGGLTGVVALLRSSPLLAAGVVITAIATAMSLFGSNTRDTNSELSKQIRLQEDLRRASVDLATQLQRDQDLSKVGFAVDDQALQFTRARRYAEVASGLSGQNGFQSYADLQSLTGLSRQALIDLAPEGGIATQTKRFESNQQGVRTVTTDVGLTNEAAREVLLLLARSIKTNADFLPGGLAGGTDRVIADPSLFPTVGVYGGLGASSPYGPSPAMPGVGYFNGPIGPQSAGISPYEQGLVANQLADAARAAAEFEERLRTLRDLGNDVGSALGSAFGSMVFNINSGRQALAGLLQQLAAIGQQQITRGFGAAFANLFAPSAAQAATSNANMPAGAIGPQLPA